MVLGEAAVLGSRVPPAGAARDADRARAHGLVSQTINDLYFVVAVREVRSTGSAILGALAWGWGPRWSARSCRHWMRPRAPRSSRSRAPGLSDGGRLGQRLAVLGVLLCVAAGLTVLGSGAQPAGGFCRLVPAARRRRGPGAPGTARESRALRREWRRRSNPVVRLACGDIAASLSRTGVAIAALGMARPP